MSLQKVVINSSCSEGHQDFAQYRWLLLAGLSPSQGLEWVAHHLGIDSSLDNEKYQNVFEISGGFIVGFN